MSTLATNGTILYCHFNHDTTNDLQRLGNLRGASRLERLGASANPAGRWVKGEPCPIAAWLGAFSQCIVECPRRRRRRRTRPGAKRRRHGHIAALGPGQLAGCHGAPGTRI